MNGSKLLYLGIDPGKRTGVCWVAKRENKVYTLDFEDVLWDNWPTWVQKTMRERTTELKDPGENVAVVCENFVHRPDKSGKKQDAWVMSPVERMIGVLWFRSLQLGYKFYLSEPANKPQGYKLASTSARASHGIDWQDAMAHCYFAAHNGLRTGKVIW